MITLHFICIMLISYPWPMRNDQGNFNGPLPVSGVLGDYRGSQTFPRFHRGIDISRTGSVFTIYSGTASTPPGTDYVRVEAHWYMHLTDRIEDGTEVIGIVDDPINPDVVGIVDGSHLHYQIGFLMPEGPFFNPLAYLGGPVNYTDEGVPIVYNVDFWREGSEITQQQVISPLWGKIDIRAHCQDRQTAGWSQPTATGGIYKLTWLIRGISNDCMVGPIYSFFFTQVEPPNNGNPVRYVYDIFHSVHAQSPFYYWATNFLNAETHSVENRYWNTKLRQGEDWDGSDALINSEAMFPDGNYRVWVMAYDIMNNGGDTLNRRGAEDEDVALDNFKPYVTRVQIEQQDKSIKYTAHWPAEPASDYDLGQLVIDKDDYCNVGKLLTFLIEFSEEMKTDVLPTLQVQFPNGTIKTVPNGQWIGNNVYRAVSGSDFIPSGTSGRATLQISGALDLAGNQNDGNPRTIAYRDAGGEWQQTEAPPDANYQFWIEPPPQALSTDPADKEKDNDIYKHTEKKKGLEPLNFQVIFNKPMDRAGYQEVNDLVRETFTVNREPRMIYLLILNGRFEMTNYKCQISNNKILNDFSVGNFIKSIIVTGDGFCIIGCIKFVDGV
ncbi:MAG: hypothetical protein ABIL02_07295 [candidate division WOR-3 bacterium]